MLVLAALGILGCGATDRAWQGPNSQEPRRPLANEVEGEIPENFKDVNEPCRGYTLFGTTLDSHLPTQVTLIDMNGRVVKAWKKMSGFPAKMLPGGSLMATKRMRPGNITVYQDSVDLVQVSWDGKLEWSFSGWDDGGTGKMMSRQHHDFQREGSVDGYWAPGAAPARSGKTLILAHKDRVVPEVSRLPIEDDVLYEVSASGELLDFVWYAGDHIEDMGFNQEERDAIANDPMYHPDRGNGGWLHINSATIIGPNRWYDKMGDERFHPDNIMISSREAAFIAIISRKTGKIVWRVGPDFSDGKPEASLGTFVGQHHAHMIPRGLPGAGNVLVFDNGGVSGFGGPNGHHKNGRAYSRVLEFNPVTLEKVWQYGDSFTSPEHFFSGYISSAQRLPNGNTLIVEGDAGRIFEVTWRKRKVVWRYDSQIKHPDGSKHIYRAYRVPPEWLPKGVNPGRYPSWKSLYPGESSL